MAKNQHPKPDPRNRSTSTGDPLQDQLRKLHREVKTGSIATRRKRWEAGQELARWLKREKVGRLQKATPRNVQRLVRSWINKGAERQTIRSKMSHVRAYFAAINRPDACPTNRELGLWKVDWDAARAEGQTRGSEEAHVRRELHPSTRLLNTEQLRRDVAAIDDTRTRLVAQLMANLGLRAKEALLLTEGQVQYRSDGVTPYRVHITRGSKGGRPRYVLTLDPESQRAVGEAVAWSHEHSNQPHSDDRKEKACLIRTGENLQQARNSLYYEARKAGFRQNPVFERDAEGHVVRGPDGAPVVRVAPKPLHTLRAGRAQELLRDLMGRMTKAKALRTVVRSLGHSRVSILHQSYAPALA